jgi:hypothetical protein
MGVGDLSALITNHKNPNKSVKNKSDKNRPIGKSIVLTKDPKHTLRSPVSVESGGLSENLDSEMAFIWAGNKTSPIRDKHSQSHAELRQLRQSYATLAIRALQLLQMCTVPKVELNLRGKMHRNLHYLQEPLLSRQT